MSLDGFEHLQESTTDRTENVLSTTGILPVCAIPRPRVGHNETALMGQTFIFPFISGCPAYFCSVPKELLVFPWLVTVLVLYVEQCRCRREALILIIANAIVMAIIDIPIVIIASAEGLVQISTRIRGLG